MTTNLGLRTLGYATLAIGLATVTSVSATAAPTNSGLNLIAQAVTKDRKTIGDIQLGLDALDYDTGLIDGIMGPKTEKAIRAYQDDNSLAVDGAPSKQLLTHLQRNPKLQAVGLQPRMRDDFEDGEYKTNPKWIVHSGEFKVRDGFLSVRLPGAGTKDDKAGVGDAVRDAFSSTNLGHQAAISQDNNVPPTFRIVATILGSGKESVRMHLGPYIGEDVLKGYRLSYDQQANGQLALVRKKGDDSTVLAEVSNVTELGDGRRHMIVWTRDASGRMVVMIDRVERLQATDQTFQGEFAGLSFSNGAGTWNLHDIAVYDAR